MTDEESNSPTGEAERVPKTASALAILSPGLGYLYVGEVARGLAANGIVVGMLAGFVALFAWLEFFPLLPFAVVLVAWAAYNFSVAREAGRRADEVEHYEPESFNHWTIYGAVLLLTYLLPIAGLGVFTQTYLWDVRSVQTAAMYPNLQRGDSVLVDRGAYRQQKPDPGDLVALEFPGASGHRVLRVVATGGANVRIAGDQFYVDDEPLETVPLPQESRTDAELDDSFDYFAEFADSQRYVVAYHHDDRQRPTYERFELDEDELFVLTDNRTKTSADSDAPDIRDSRDVGPVDEETVRGRPTHVAWSTADDGTRWGRIGLRLQ